MNLNAFVYSQEMNFLEIGNPLLIVASRNLIHILGSCLSSLTLKASSSWINSDSKSSVAEFHPLKVGLELKLICRCITHLVPNDRNTRIQLRHGKIVKYLGSARTH